MRIDLENGVATLGLAIGFLLIAKDLGMPLMIAAAFCLLDRMAWSGLARRMAGRIRPALAVSVWSGQRN